MNKEPRVSPRAVDKVLDAIGRNWRQPPPAEYRTRHAKYDDRATRLAVNLRLAHGKLNDYLGPPPRRVLDISCGVGMFLELMRYCGHQVYGVEPQYDMFLVSQDIPHMRHWIVGPNSLPLPLETGAYDLVTCMHAISNYSTPWITVLDEMFRLSRRTVLLACNGGVPHDAHKAWLSGYAPGGWRLTAARGTVYRWDKA